VESVELERESAVELGIMFFSSQAQAPGSAQYRLLADAARFADEHGFAAVWTPERHFHEFGGIFPNPALTSAALAMITRRLTIRAGSLISPLHDSLRMAEEWSVVDNLSDGRVEVAFGSGWNVNDFVIHPDAYADRHRVMYRQIDEVQRLWRGEALRRVNSAGKEVEVRTFPRPVQPSLPVWITASGNSEDTFVRAGGLGAHVLTSMIFQDAEAVERRIGVYRDALERGGHERDAGRAAVMLHTFVGPDLEEVRERVRAPLREYLRSAVGLENRGAQGGGSISGGLKAPAQEIPDDMLEELLDITFERYFDTASLLGTPEKCAAQVERLQRAGVDEIACLIDFGLPDADILAGLEQLHAMRELVAV
jgi:natural product biosynthesis luciferase-like monooxygenase protein